MTSTLNRELYFKYLLYDKNGKYKRQINEVEAGSFNYASLSRLKKSASITMMGSSDIDLINDEIQIICVINGEEFSISRLLMTSPKKAQKNNLRQVECYSRLKILDDAKLENRLLIPIGTNIINEVKRRIGTKGAFSIVDSNLTLSADKIFEIGTPELDVINNLLETANYDSLTDDRFGSFVSKPYILPSERQIEVTYTDDPETTIVEQDIFEDLDLFEVPNVFIRYTNHPDINPPMKAIYENNNPASPTSTVNRRRIVDVKEVKNVADIDTLTAITKKDAADATNKYSNLEFQTAINPAHDYFTCVYFKVGSIADKYIETSFSMDLRTGGTMKHTARKVVFI